MISGVKLSKSDLGVNYDSALSLLSNKAMRVIFLTLILTFGTPALAQKRGAALEKCMLEGANVILNIWNREEHISNEVQIMLAGVGAYSACEKRGHVRRDQLSDKEIKSVLNKVYINLKNYWLLSREA